MCWSRLSIGVEVSGVVFILSSSIGIGERKGQGISFFQNTVEVFCTMLVTHVLLVTCIVIFGLVLGVGYVCYGQARCVCVRWVGGCVE